MPNVSPDEVTRLAALARIELAAGEPERLAHDLGNILEHVASLEAADAAEVTHAAAERNVFRADASEVRIGENEAKEAFPEKEDSFMKVPRVF